jgi:hypothetical protein
VGFEDFGMQDDFSTLQMARRLIQGGALIARTKGEKKKFSLQRGGQKESDDEDD